MKKALDKTLHAIMDLDDAVNFLRSEMSIHDSHVNEDVKEIIQLLDKSSEILLESIIVFWKHRDL